MILRTGKKITRGCIVQKKNKLEGKMDINRSMGWVNAIVIALTFILFAAALFFKGFTHDLLLEAGVFLVSVKLIIGMHQIHRKLDELKETQSSR